MGDMLTLAANAPNVKTKLQDGVNSFVDVLAQNGTIMNALRILGGLIILVCIVCLVGKKVFPQNETLSRIAQNVNFKWFILGILFGAMLMLPKEVIGSLAFLAGVILQLILDFVFKVFS